jgi:hypothetical protein
MAAVDLAEHQRNELQERFNRRRPEFVLFIDWMIIREIPDDESRCEMLLTVNVTNAGESSIAQHWTVMLRTEEGNEIELNKREPLPHEVITFTTDVHTDVKGSDFIKYKTHPSGIPRGDGCRGFVMCYIPKNLKPKWSVVVTVNDAFGETWESSRYLPWKRPTADSFTEIGGWPHLDIRHRPLGGV